MTVQAHRPGGDLNVVDAVRKASDMAQKSPRRGPIAFSFTTSTPAESFVAGLLGLYLAYAVARLPYVFPSLLVPRLTMVAMIGFVLVLVLSVPQMVWKELWQRAPTLRYVAAIAVLGVATAPFGIWRGGSLYFFRTRFSITLAIFVCCFVFLRDRKNLRRAIVVYVLCVAAVAIKTLSTAGNAEFTTDEFGNQVALSEAEVEKARVNVGDALDANDYGAVLATAFPLALWLGVGSVRRRLFWTPIALLMVAAVVPTASRGAMLGFGAAATALIGVGSRGWRRGLTILLVLAGFAIFVKVSTSGQMNRFTDFGADDYNLTASEGRWRFWKQGVVWAIKRPWGYGMNNFPMYWDWMNGGDRAAHSTWVQYFMELGWAGLAAFVAIYAGLVRQLLQLRRRAINWTTGGAAAKEEEQLAGYMVAVLAAYGVTATFLSIAYIPFSYMILGIAAASLLGSPVPENVAQKTPEDPNILVHGRRTGQMFRRTG